MFHALTRFSVRLVERWLPDPYLFVILLTLVAGLAAMGVESRGPMEVVNMWGDGFWGLLPFTMQMVLVLVTDQASERREAASKRQAAAGSTP